MFEFFWVRLPDEMPELIGERDRFLPALLESLSDRRPTTDIPAF